VVGVAVVEVGVLDTCKFPIAPPTPPSSSSCSNTVTASSSSSLSSSCTTLGLADDEDEDEDDGIRGQSFGKMTSQIHKYITHNSSSMIVY